MQASPPSTLVERWFGSAFEQLHPMLQSLHRHGGVLRGPVDISLGQGLAKWLGRIATRRLGLLPAPARNQLEVIVAIDQRGILWSRRFNSGTALQSLFAPVGHFPDGYWKEETGPVAVTMGVGLAGGNWQWLPRSTRIHGRLLPAWLTPKIEASKSIVDGRYAFSVSASLPLLGPVLSYRGTLTAMAEQPRDG